MAMFLDKPTMLLFLGILLQFSCFVNSHAVVGVNYGEEMQTKPRPKDMPDFLNQTSIQSIRFLGVDTFAIKEIGSTNLSIVISIGNGDIVGMADIVHAEKWVKETVTFASPAKIILVTIGNEVLTAESQQKMQMLVKAMQNLQDALRNAGFGDKVKVSTIFSMSILGISDPPSATVFERRYMPYLTEVVKFLRDNKSPFMIDVWPFFAYEIDQTPEVLKYCLFQDTVGKVDPGNKLKYMNMFDAMVDSVRTALNKIGAADIPIVVSATGWPSRGDEHEVGATMENAKLFNFNLVKHLTNATGTPLSPNVPVNTYISSLFNEDAKVGPTISSSSYGLFNSADFSPLYDAGLVPAGKINKPAPEVDKMADSANWFNLKTGPPKGVA